MIVHQRSAAHDLLVLWWSAEQPRKPLRLQACKEHARSEHRLAPYPASAIVRACAGSFASGELDQAALSKASQRLPLLTIYFLFHRLIHQEERLPQFEEMAGFAADFNEPSIESFVAHILTEQEPSWTLERFERLHDAYFKSSRGANSTRIGLVLEAAFSLYLAELNRAAGLEGRARDLIAFATESCPAYAALRAFETTLSNEGLPEICWYKILLPPPPPTPGPTV
jgi:hypothetical protein